MEQPWSSIHSVIQFTADGWRWCLSVEYGHNFVTATKVFVTTATMLVTFAAVLVSVEFCSSCQHGWLPVSYIKFYQITPDTHIKICTHPTQMSVVFGVLVSTVPTCYAAVFLCCVREADIFLFLVWLADTMQKDATGAGQSLGCDESWVGQKLQKSRLESLLWPWWAVFSVRSKCNKRAVLQIFSLHLAFYPINPIFDWDISILGARAGRADEWTATCTM